MIDPQNPFVAFIVLMVVVFWPVCALISYVFSPSRKAHRDDQI